jgi:hypothetical protein
MALLKTLVIAKYQENIDWSTRLSPDIRVVVIRKGVDLPVIGREAASFFWYIKEHYDELKGYYYFVQGNPFAHAPDLLRQLAKEPVEYEEYGTWEVLDDGEGRPHHPGLPIKRVYERLFKKEAPRLFGFKAGGGQFVVSAERIKQHPKSFYEDAYKVCEEEEKAPWVYERLWRTMFS